jgi:hypothetical protein
MGRELELPKTCDEHGQFAARFNVRRLRLTAMAATKLDCRFLNRQHRETTAEQRYETEVWMMKMTGMMARSVSLSAVSCEANLVNTVCCQLRNRTVVDLRWIRTQTGSK